MARIRVGSEGGQSCDPRDKFKAMKPGGNRKLRCASMRFDRFGRIDFNKQKELSQASLEGDDKSFLSGSGDANRQPGSARDHN